MRLSAKLERENLQKAKELTKKNSKAAYRGSTANYV